MQKNPLVSIIIPVYNGANYMREAIDSALNQTYENIEVIVVNDGSKDEGETERIALSYGDRIRYIKKENGGVSSALNLGIKNMAGDYFSWLSHDDVYTPVKIESQINSLMDVNAEKILSICLTDTIDKNSNVISPSTSADKSGILNWEETVMYIIKKGIQGCSLLIPKEVFAEVGFFDENLRYCQDVFMWWQIALLGYGLVFCNELGVHYRVHGNQLTQTGSSLYHSEARIIGKVIIPQFVAISKHNMIFIYEYAKKEAIHGNNSNVDDCISLSKDKRLLNLLQIINLKFLKLYGKIRPSIRKLYYLFFRKIKTE